MNDPVRLQIGGVIIHDVMNPTRTEVEEVYPHMMERHKRLRRWSDHPKALTVHQHKKLVVRMVDMSKMDFDMPETFLEVKQWAEHHDDHEGLTGDIVGPMKTLIGRETDILDRLETVWDKAICRHLGILYPSETIKGLVHRYDKAAETLEWIHAMGRPRMTWNHAVPAHLEAHGQHLIAWAKRLA